MVKSMGVKELVELLYTAYNRFTSINAQWQHWYRSDIMNALIQNQMLQKSANSMSFLSSNSVEQPVNQTPYKQGERYYHRLWWQKPDCWRDETRKGMDGHRGITVYCNGNWWVFSSGINTLHTNVMPEKTLSHIKITIFPEEEVPKLEDRINNIPSVDPSFLLLSHSLHPVSETIYQGRPAIQVRAVYQKGQDYIPEGFFWSCADEYNLLVDQEYGILLRYSAILNGQEFAVSAVDQVIFDEPIPHEIFDVASIAMP